MERQKLAEFYSDQMMVQVVKSFLVDTLKSETIERVFKKQDVSGIADAKIAIEKSFVLLQTMFAEKERQRSKSNR